MFGTFRPGASAYRQISLATDALAASPHQLIVMLFDGALNAIQTAQAQMQQQDIEGKGRSITRAIDIIGSGLHASLDSDNGGEIAQNLAALYDYLIRQLLEANRHNDTRRLDEATTLLQSLKASWVAIGQTAVSKAAEFNPAASKVAA